MFFFPAFLTDKPGESEKFREAGALRNKKDMSEQRARWEEVKQSQANREMYSLE